MSHDNEISFTVPGVAAPGGSKRAFKDPKTGRIVVKDDARNNAGWRQRVAVFASQAMAGRSPFDGPVAVRVVFYMPRPKGHYGTGRNAGVLKAGAVMARPITKPDATKLWRSTEDALKGIIWGDDSQVVTQSVSKYYEVPGRSPCAEIEVMQLRPGA